MTDSNIWIVQALIALAIIYFFYRQLELTQQTYVWKHNFTFLIKTLDTLVREAWIEQARSHYGSGTDILFSQAHQCNREFSRAPVFDRRGRRMRHTLYVLTVILAAFEMLELVLRVETISWGWLLVDLMLLAVLFVRESRRMQDVRTFVTSRIFLDIHRLQKAVIDIIGEDYKQLEADLVSVPSPKEG